jgi:D-tyrosyl-tRNA(Tyr) deacylase
MRAVVQRVESSEVYIDGNQFAAISKGLLIFLGIEKGDMEIDAENLLDKIIYLRIFEDGNCKMNLSLLDVSGDLMVVSQFTLLADCRKGRRPAFTNAAKPEDALKLYNYSLLSQR